MIELFENNGYFKLSGFLSKTNISRASKNNINIIVNGRSIRNYKIVNAVLEGYKGRYVSGRYPICVLNISVDPSLVDVNIHPTKQEVRFSNEEELLNLIKTSISSTLLQVNMISEDNPKISFEKDDDEEIENKVTIQNRNDDRISKRLFEQEPEKPAPIAESQTTSETKSLPIEAEGINSVPDYAKEPDPIIKGLKIGDFEADRKTSVMYHEEEKEPEPETKETFQQQQYSLNEDDSSSDSLQSSGKLPKLYFIGQLHGTYLLFQDPDNFYLIDQHAAYERINYEKIHRELASEQVIVNELLVPVNLTFTPAEGYLINEKMMDLKKMGMIIDEFGTGTYVIRQVPLWFPKGKEKEYAEDVISKVISNRDADRYAMQDDLAKSLACKHSIKANQFLDAKSIDYLLKDLGKCENPYNCPHGRPVIVRFPITDIEKWFKRIV
jgi:DNA mismatch repair protein MutL